MEHLAANVGPKFLQLVGETIPEDQETKRGSVSTEGAVFRGMVDVGYAGGHRVSK